MPAPISLRITHQLLRANFDRILRECPVQWHKLLSSILLHAVIEAW
jgi:hypothetical protein